MDTHLHLQCNTPPFSEKLVRRHLRPRYYMRTMSILMLLGSVLTFRVNLAHAETFVMRFEFTRFYSVENPAPTDPAIGTIIYEANSLSIWDPIQKIDSIDLTLGSHSYSITELGTDIGMIGGTLNGLNACVSHTDDFWIQWNDSLMPISFAYTSSDLFGAWSVGNGNPGFPDADVFSITPVPEPATISLIALFLLSLGARQRLQYSRRQAAGLEITR